MTKETNFENGHELPSSPWQTIEFDSPRESRGADVPLAFAKDARPAAAVVCVITNDTEVDEYLCDELRAANYVTECYESAEAFLAAAEPSRATCFLVDIQLPGMSGIEFVARLRETDPDVCAIVLTHWTGAPPVVQAMQAGAEQVVLKPIVRAVLLDAVADAFKKARPAHGRSIAAPAKIRALTPREQQIMDMVVAGQTNKAIAHELEISRRTVEAHRAKIMKKMGAPSVAHLVQLVLASPRHP